MAIFDRIEDTISRAAAGLAIFGGLGLIFATLATCTSIILKLIRRGLDTLFDPAVIGQTLPWLRPILGEEELVTFGVGFALFAALPWAMLRKGHIKIDLFEPVFAPRFNRFLDLLGDIALTTLAWLIMTRQWFLIFKKPRGSKEPVFDLFLQADFAQIVDRIRSSQESQILGLPLWPTYIVAELCIVAFFLVGLFCVWRSARAFISPQSEAI